MITYEEAVKYLLDIPKFTKNKNNDNLKNILKALGNPEKAFRIIHVAGTNGKGSTCAFMNNILIRGGYSVGMFTSPHLVKVNERMKINGKDISDGDFLSAFLNVKEQVDKIIKAGGEHPSFFEYMFLTGIEAFRHAKVSYVILEVGLGGRLDATNVIEKPEVCVITSVSKDHMEILGDTVEEIAIEKAGIIKSNVPVVYYGEEETVSAVIEENAGEKGAPTIAVKNSYIKIVSKTNKSIDFCLAKGYDKYGVLSVPFVMEYQTRNATLAIKALEQLDIDISEAAFKEGLMNTRWAGRMELIEEGVYLDGAHNYEGVYEFKEFVNELSYKCDGDIYILFSVVKEKEYYEMMNLIEEIDKCKGFLVAPVQNARAAAVDDLAMYLMKSGKDVYTFNSLSKAYDFGKELKGEAGYLFCVGSLYMVGEVKAHLEVRND